MILAEFAIESGDLLIATIEMLVSDGLLIEIDVRRGVLSNEIAVPADVLLNDVQCDVPLSESEIAILDDVLLIETSGEEIEIGIGEDIEMWTEIDREIESFSFQFSVLKQQELQCTLVFDVIRWVIRLKKMFKFTFPDDTQTHNQHSQKTQFTLS